MSVPAPRGGSGGGGNAVTAVAHAPTDTAAAAAARAHQGSTQRFLFLDVDGVLHPTSCLTKEAWFDERCMANFKRIVDATQVGSTCNRGVRSRNVVSYTVRDGTCLLPLRADTRRIDMTHQCLPATSAASFCRPLGDWLVNREPRWTRPSLSLALVR